MYEVAVSLCDSRDGSYLLTVRMRLWRDLLGSLRVADGGMWMTVANWRAFDVASVARWQCDFYRLLFRHSGVEMAEICASLSVLWVD